MSRFPPLGGAAARHLVIDMQRLFDEDTVWHTPALRRILPNVVRLAEGFAGRNLFCRFTLPRRPEDARGQWQEYYRHWHMLTGPDAPPGVTDLVDELRSFARPDTLIDKAGYSGLPPAMAERLWRDGVRHLLLSGVETDVCVLATALSALDHGFAVSIATDATGSADESAHAAMLTVIYPRLSQQIRLLTTADALAEIA